jgi:hypothetical protein
MELVVAKRRAHHAGESVKVLSVFDDIVGGAREEWEQGLGLVYRESIWPHANAGVARYLRVTALGVERSTMWKMRWLGSGLAGFARLGWAAAVEK